MFWSPHKHTKRRIIFFINFFVSNPWQIHVCHFFLVLFLLSRNHSHSLQQVASERLVDECACKVLGKGQTDDIQLEHAILCRDTVNGDGRRQQLQILRHVWWSDHLFQASHQFVGVGGAENQLLALKQGQGIEQQQGPILFGRFFQWQEIHQLTTCKDHFVRLSRTNNGG